MCADDYSKLASLAKDIERRIWNLQDADLLMRRPFVLESHRYDDQTYLSQSMERLRFKMIKKGVLF
jgi:hypothetical protein